MKEYKRKCPSCNKNLIYKNSNTLLKANNKNTLCKECRSIKIKNKKLNDKYIKNCPLCNKEMIYKRKGALVLSLKLNSCCQSCSTKQMWDKGIFKHDFTQNHRKNISKSHKKSRIFQNVMKSDWYVEKIRQKAIGRKHTPETIEKIKSANTGKIITDNQKIKISVGLKKYYESPENIKKNSDALKKYFSNQNNRAKRSKITKKKMGIWLKTPEGITWSKKQRKRVKSYKFKKQARLRLIKRIEKNKNNGNQISPFYNKNAIPILEQKAKELGITDLQHAENGGEYYIRELGYWVDGYSPSKNIVIEIDEKHHEKQKEKDRQRQKEIEEFLNCKFIRIDEQTKQTYEID